jgi:hypothetical protein
MDPVRLGTREADFLKLVRGWLAVRGCRVYRRNVAVQVAEYKGKRRVIRSGEKGQADLYGWFPAPRRGLHFECEVKIPGNWPTRDQIDWLIDANDSGAVGFWVASIDDLEYIHDRLMTGHMCEVTHDGHVRLIRPGGVGHGLSARG